MTPASISWAISLQVRAIRPRREDPERMFSGGSAWVSHKRLYTASATEQQPNRNFRQIMSECVRKLL